MTVDRCLSRSPAHGEAFRIAVQVLTALEDWSGLLTRYESCLTGMKLLFRSRWLAMARLAHTKLQDTELALAIVIGRSGPPGHTMFLLNC